MPNIPKNARLLDSTIFRKGSIVYDGVAAVVQNNNLDDILRAAKSGAPKIMVGGSSSIYFPDSAEKTLKKSKEFGKELAKGGAITITGGTRHVPAAVNSGAYKQGGLTLGFSALNIDGFNQFVPGEIDNYSVLVLMSMLSPKEMQDFRNKVTGAANPHLRFLLRDEANSAPADGQGFSEGLFGSFDEDSRGVKLGLPSAHLRGTNGVADHAPQYFKKIMAKDQHHLILESDSPKELARMLLEKSKPRKSSVEILEFLFNSLAVPNDSMNYKRTSLEGNVLEFSSLDIESVRYLGSQAIVNDPKIFNAVGPRVYINAPSFSGSLAYEDFNSTIKNLETAANYVEDLAKRNVTLIFDMKEGYSDYLIKVAKKANKNANLIGVVSGSYDPETTFPVNDVSLAIYLNTKHADAVLGSTQSTPLETGLADAMLIFSGGLRTNMAMAYAKELSLHIGTVPSTGGVALHGPDILEKLDKKPETSGKIIRMDSPNDLNELICAASDEHSTVSDRLFYGLIKDQIGTAYKELER